MGETADGLAVEQRDESTTFGSEQVAESASKKSLNTKGSTANRHR